MGSSDQTPSPADGLGGPDGPRLKRLPFVGDGMEGRQHQQPVTSSWRVANETCDTPDPNASLPSMGVTVIARG